MRKQALKLSPLVVAVAAAIPAMSASTSANAELSGNIGVYSAYVLRGITNAMENDGTAVQGGIDWSSPSGFYLGYWGSNLGYNSVGSPVTKYDDSGTAVGTEDDCATTGDCPAQGFENDFYGGYSGTMGEFGYDVGVIYYYYIGVTASDAAEIPLSVSYKGATLGLKYLTSDVAWGNTGDIYWTLGYDFALPSDFTLGASLGYYTYEKKGDYIPESPQSKSSAFRHLNLTLSHPIGETGADMSITGIIGGEDRFGNDQASTVVLGVSYGFDVSSM